MSTPTLDELIAEYLAAIDAGEEPERERLMADDPEHADGLREFFADFDRMRGAVERAEDAATREFVAEDVESLSQAEGTSFAKLSDETQQRLERLLHKLKENQAKDARLGETVASAKSEASRVIDGKYKLLQQIGSGGMGEVWMAEQEKPVRRRVALKLIKTGMDSKEVVARFEAERQALAMMDHQHIAKVLDGGSTEQGRPYFVMELVQGIPITKYCDKNKLSVNERLNLFIPVCNAVQHAHQKGIIHRDLKPSNILVTLYDGRPVAKVIDFGLAKALQHQARLTDKTLFTEFGQVVGTLQYMSPEQAEMNALDIDTRTDIYSLGVILYELLTGSTPIDRDTLDKQAIYKVLETIRETDPPRPSIRLSASGDAITGISQQRQIEPNKLTQILRGDLDWIVMKALEKDRTRRYQHAISVEEELINFLSGNAISARPPSISYRSSRFIRRNLKTVLLGTASVLALCIATCVAVFWAVEANSSRLRAEEAADDADMERGKAERERLKAVNAQARLEAEIIAVKNARDRAQAAEEEKSKSLARLGLALADARSIEGRPIDAKSALESVPEEFRDEIWNLVWKNLEGSENSIDTESCTHFILLPKDGRLVTSDQSSTIRVWSRSTVRNSKRILADGPVTQLVAFNDGTRRFASGGLSGRLQVWFENGKLDSDDHVSGAPITTIDVSHDGERLLVGNQNGEVQTIRGDVSDTFKVFDSKIRMASLVDSRGAFVCSDGETIRYLSAEGNEIDSLSAVHDEVEIGPTGRLMACSSGSQVKVYEIENGFELKAEFAGGDAIVDAIAFSPDGTELVLASGGGVISSHDMYGQERLKIVGTHLPVRTIAFDMYGEKIVTLSDGGTIHFWDARYGTNSHAMSVEATSRMSTNTGNSCFIGSWSEQILIPSLEELKSHRVFHEDDSILDALFVDGRNEILVLTTDSIVRKRADTYETLQTLSLEFEKSRPIAFAGLSSGGWIAVGFSSGRIVQLDATGKIKADTWCRRPWILEVAEPLELLFGADYYGGVFSWDTQQKEMRWFDRRVRASAIKIGAKGDYLAIGGGDGRIQLWDPKTHELKGSLDGHRKTITALAIHPDNRLLFSAGLDQRLRIWNLDTLQQVTSIFLGAGVYHDIAVTKSTISCLGKGRLLQWELTKPPTGSSPSQSAIDIGTGFDSSGDRSGKLTLWKAGRQSVFASYDAHYSSVTSFDVFGELVATASRDNSVVIWDVAKAEIAKRLVGFGDDVLDVEWANDGGLLAAAGKDQIVRVWDTESWFDLGLPITHNHFVSALAFSEDSRLLASGSWSGELQVWDLHDKKKAFYSRGSQKKLTHIKFDPEGRLVLQYSNGSRSLLDLATDKVAEVSERIATRRGVDQKWHRARALEAELDNDFFAALYHRAVLTLGREPSQLDQARLKAIAAMEECVADEQHPSWLSQAVSKAKETKQGIAELISKADALEINNLCWNLAVARKRAVPEPLLNLQKAIVQKFGTSTYANTLGAVLYRQGNYADAISTLEANLLREPDAFDYGLLVLCHAKLRQYSVAEKYHEIFQNCLQTEVGERDSDLTALVTEVGALQDDVSEKEDAESKGLD